MKRKMMNRLIKWKEKKYHKPLILKGVRQVGKTHLLTEFGKNHFEKCHYLNFEKNPNLGRFFEKDLDPKRILTDISFYLNSSITPGKDLLIFDEIQQAPKALTSLKYFQEDCPELHICSAGSLLGINLNSGSFPVGKVTMETLRPLSFQEFLMANEDKAIHFIEAIKMDEGISDVVHEHLWQQLQYYFITGGLPESITTFIEYKENLFEAFSQVRKKQNDLLNAYYADIAKHSGKINAMHIDRVFRSIPTQLQQAHNGTISKFKFKGVVPGISHYDRLAGAIDWLEAAGLIIKVYIVNSGRIPLKGYIKENFFKLLLFDVGILGAMSEISPKHILRQDYGSYKGYFAENYLAQELLAQGRDTLFSWQDKKSEIEFVLEIDGEIVPIEVKSGKATKSKSLQQFAEKYHSPYQVIFSAKPLDRKRTVRHYPLYLAGHFPLS